MDESTHSVSHRELELAWAAGFADGEAWFGTVHRQKWGQYGFGGKDGYWRLDVSIGQKDRRVLDRFCAAVGEGRVYGPYRRDPGFWHYKAVAQSARRAIMLLLPYLSEVKQEQIDRARVRCADWNEINGKRPASARRTHCPKGHPYDEANTYQWRGTRSCRACRRAGKERARCGSA